MVEEKKDEKYTQLRTMIPKEVYLELTSLAKARESFTGAWDYGNAIKELLWCYKVFHNVNTRLDKVEIRMDNLEAEQFKESTKEPEKKEKKRKLLGSNEEEEL